MSEKYTVPRFEYIGISKTGEINSFTLFANVISIESDKVTFSRYLNFGKIKSASSVTISKRDFMYYYQPLTEELYDKVVLSECGDPQFFIPDKKLEADNSYLWAEIHERPKGTNFFPAIVRFDSGCAIEIHRFFDYESKPGVWFGEHAQRTEYYVSLSYLDFISAFDKKPPFGVTVVVKFVERQSGCLYSLGCFGQGADFDMGPLICEWAYLPKLPNDVELIGNVRVR